MAVQGNGGQEIPGLHSSGVLSLCLLVALVPVALLAVSTPALGALSGGPLPVMLW